MILQTASQVVVPVVPADQDFNIVIYRASFDLVSHRYVLEYGVAGGQVVQDRGAVGAALLTAIENFAQGRIEARLGISGTTVATP